MSSWQFLPAFRWQLTVYSLHTAWSLFNYIAVADAKRKFECGQAVLLIKKTSSISSSHFECCHWPFVALATKWRISGNLGCICISLYMYMCTLWEIYEWPADRRSQLEVEWVKTLWRQPKKRKKGMSKMKCAWRPDRGWGCECTAADSTTAQLLPLRDDEIWLSD